MKGWITGLCCVLAFFLFFSCGSEKKAEETAVDLPQIQERKELVVLTVNSSVSYFHYRGEPMGFQYELAQQFAKSLGLDLKVKVVKDEEQLVSSLLKGEGDLVAYNLIITNPLKDSLIYCGEEDITAEREESFEGCHGTGRKESLCQFRKIPYPSGESEPRTGRRNRYL